jgi:UDP-GlcNAc:undecaprenyl-phosphate GlcNAc-1-phosphate transferase
VREYVLTLLVTATVTYILTPLVRRGAIKAGAVGAVRDRDVHVVPTPRWGGLAMYGGLAAGLLVATQLTPLNSVFSSTGPLDMESGLLLAGGLLVAIGIVDDRWGMNAVSKLAGQVAAGAILVASGCELGWLPLPGGGTFSPTFNQATLLTILVVVATINAVNFIDGLDGLAAGIVGIASISFFLYYYSLTHVLRLTAEAGPALASAVLAGMCLGFLPHNFFPARIFMGDTGSMLLGLLLAYAPISSISSLDPLTLTSQQAYRIGTVNRFPEILPLLLPMAILVIPYADMLMAVVRRTRAGISPFAPDRKHLHHRLLDIGHSHRLSVLIMYLWAAMFSALVVWLSIAKRPSWVFATITLGAVLALLLMSMPRLRWWERQRRRNLALAGAVAQAGSGVKAGSVQAQSVQAGGGQAGGVHAAGAQAAAAQAAGVQVGGAAQAGAQSGQAAWARAASRAGGPGQAGESPRRDVPSGDSMSTPMGAPVPADDFSAEAAPRTEPPAPGSERMAAGPMAPGSRAAGPRAPGPMASGPRPMSAEQGGGGAPADRWTSPLDERWPGDGRAARGDGVRGEAEDRWPGAETSTPGGFRPGPLDDAWPAEGTARADSRTRRSDDLWPAEDGGRGGPRARRSDEVWPAEGGGRGGSRARPSDELWPAEGGGHGGSRARPSGELWPAEGGARSDSRAPAPDAGWSDEDATGAFLLPGHSDDRRAADDDAAPGDGLTGEPDAGLDDPHSPAGAEGDPAARPRSVVGTIPPAVFQDTMPIPGHDADRDAQAAPGERGSSRTGERPPLWS